MSSPVFPARTGATAADLRPAVTVLAGFWPAASYAVGRALLAADPTLLLVRHDLAGLHSGAVHRVVRTGAGLLEDEAVSLVHGCAACTLREDVLPTLVRLARTNPGRDIVLLLPEAVEPEMLAAACGHCLVDDAPVTDAVRFDSYVTVVDAARLLADLDSGDELAHRGLHAAEDDHRGVADVVAHQIEYADTVLLWGQAPGGGFETTRLAVLLQRLAPWATHLVEASESRVDCTALSAAVRRTGRHHPDTPGVLSRGLEGYPVGVHEPVPDCRVVSVVFTSRRPLHPQRLHDALRALTSGTLRGRGHLWLASQPDTVVVWQSAGGGLGMGSLGRWLAALSERERDEVSPARRLAATVDWDPVHGDRGTHLAFVGFDFDLDPAALRHRLAGCELTDAELAAGPETWQSWPDPFDGCFDTDPD